MFRPRTKAYLISITEGGGPPYSGLVTHGAIYEVAADSFFVPKIEGVPMPEVLHLDERVSAVFFEQAGLIEGDVGKERLAERVRDKVAAGLLRAARGNRGQPTRGRWALVNAKHMEHFEEKCHERIMRRNWERRWGLETDETGAPK